MRRLRIKYENKVEDPTRNDGVWGTPTGTGITWTKAGTGLRSEDLSYIENLSYIFVEASISATILLFSLDKSASCRYIMWPAS